MTDLVHAYTHLYNELDAHMLVVQLVPLDPRKRGYNEGGMKRVCVNVPPTWYRKLCGRHLSSREIRRGKPDTKIKRKNVLSLLAQLSEGLVPRSKCLGELEGVARAVKT